MFYRFAAFIMLLVLVACTQAPQPMRHSRTGFDPSALRLRDGGTVMILPIEGTARPMGQIIAQSLADSLAARGIPATPNQIQEPPYKVRAQAVLERDKNNPHIKGVIYWRFTSKEDQIVHESTQDINVDRSRWEYGDQALIDNLVETAADEFAGYLQDTREREAVELDERDKDVVFSVRNISGGIGDGNRALRKAMELTLRQAGAVVRPKPVKGGYILDAVVDILEPYEGMQRIKITWIVRDDSGKELGQARQNNQLKEGRLLEPWGRLAYDISRAAMQSIGIMVERHRSELQFQRSRIEPATTAAPGKRNNRFVAPY